MERWRQYQSTVLIYAILLLVLSGMVVPLVWTLLTSFKYNVDVTLGWIPPRWTTDNYTGVFSAFSFLRYYANSLFIATAVTVVQVATSALAAYAFARLQFRGRDVLFLGYLSTMMIPADVLMIPQFVLMKKIPEWLNAVLATDFFSGFLYLKSHYIGHPVGLDSFLRPHCAGVFQCLWDVHAAAVFAGHFARDRGGGAHRRMLGMGRILARGGAAGQTGAGCPSDLHLPRALAGLSLAADYDGFGFHDGAAGGIGQAVGPVRQRLRADLCGIGTDARANDRGFRLFSAVVYQRDSARGGEGVSNRTCHY